MSVCQHCGADIAPGNAYCLVCGTPVNAEAGAPQPDPAQQPPIYEQAGQPYVDPTDHTAQFDPQDIAENKIFAMLPYLIGSIGLLIALLARKESSYVMFNVRQGLKLVICNAVITLATVLLCWTILVPIAGVVCSTILQVLMIIAFFQVCGGKAKEPAIISGFAFLN